MKNLAVKIHFVTETSTQCLSNYNVSVGFNENQTKLFNEFGDATMLQIWCERVLDQQFPLYKCNIVKIDILTDKA